MKVLKGLLILILGIIVLACIHYSSLRKEDWYGAFFKELSQQNIKSYRFINIWAQGERYKKEDYSYIGGQHKNYRVWKKSVENFLFEAKQHLEYKILFEVFVDQRTYALCFDTLAKWEKTYPHTFKITLIDQLKDDDFLIEPLKQCSEGIPAICSDVLRVMYLHNPDYEVNVYMDVDTLIEGYRSRKKYSSINAFGLQLPGKGIFNTLEMSPNKIIWNNDFIVDKGTDKDWDLIQSFLKQNFTLYQKAYRDIYRRSIRSKLESFSDYLEDLEERALWWQQNSHMNFNQNSMIGQVLSGGFFADMLFRELSYPYKVNNCMSEKNYRSWAGEETYINNVFMSFDMNRARFDQQSSIFILKFTLMLYDYLYFTQH
ncbi:hypothetical protein EBQ91_00535, partial [bacterium]|nr:hypothetical protein [bacterium]